MSQRSDVTKWLWCVVAVYMGPACSPVGGVGVRTPPKNPSTIEAQAKFFQDFFSVQLSPYKIEFGHVCEDPNTWEQRYEKKDFKNHRDMGKVRWGDKKGGYGEHYWDLNHAGHADNNGGDEYDGSSDDGSYNHDLDHAHDDHAHDTHDHDVYDEPSEKRPTYSSDEYDPEQSAKYDEIGRAKRAHPWHKVERKLVREKETHEEESPKPQKIHRKPKERLHAAPTQQVEKVVQEDFEETKEPPKRRSKQRRPENNQEDTENAPNDDEKESNKVNQQEEQNQQEQNQEPQYYTKRQEKQFVPYEQGAGLRQHYQPAIAAAASVPRLFLEPTTGHVVDRATGQAYVLQPIQFNN